ncbi:MAG TPA: hypothetical protein VD969_18325 [Symbiobacteriaceae bacterium]|nr:hypothetical protein [Symbiobacteriaceae bacterium]
MRRWIALVLGCLALVAAGCSAGARTRQTRPEVPAPALVVWEVATGVQTLLAEPGAKVVIDGWSTLVTVRFSRPVDAGAVSLQIEGDLWHADPRPIQTEPHRVTFRLWSELAGNYPLTLTLTGPTVATLRIEPRTPPVNPDEEAALLDLGRQIWETAVTGDAGGLEALIAPAAHLSAPGGEFYADGAGSGLQAVLAWARTRSGSVPVIEVSRRLSYSSMDLISMQTSRGRLDAYVTIPGRRIVKLFGVN